MSLPEPGTLMALLAAAAIAGLLVGILPDWRKLVGHRLPIHAFLRRQGAQVDDRDALVRAEMRCAVCEASAQCERRLAAGADSPLAGCPNSELLRTAAARPRSVAAPGADAA